MYVFKEERLMSFPSRPFRDILAGGSVVEAKVAPFHR
jgi:hypothetical protein